MRVIKFIRLAAYPYRYYFLAMVFAILIVSIDATVKPYLIKLLVDAATTPLSNAIMPLFILFSIFQALNVAAWTLADWCAIRFKGELMGNITSILMNRLSHYSHSFFQNHLAGSLTSKINDASQIIPSLIFTVTHQFINFTLTALISLIFLYKVHVFFAASLSLWMTFFLVLTYTCLKKAIPLSRDYAEAKSRIGGYIADIFSNMVNVRSFTAHSYEMGHLGEINQKFIKKAQCQGYFLMKFYLMQGIAISIYIIGFVIGLILLHARNVVTPGDFVLVFMLNFLIADKLFDLSHQFRDFIPNWGTVDQALKMLEEPLEISDSPTAQPLVVTKGEILFSRVHFHYKDTQSLFQNKSLTIPSGQKVGLVGYSGGGKTTFINLILRLFDVTAGHISIDGQNIKNVTQESLHQNIGLIPQDPSLFHRTLKENINYGRFNATEAEIMDAARRAYAHEFIMKLPKGYDSLVGERGVKLSGGQRQRVAIARVILKNPPVLILDEATSQLDSVTEKYIQESLWNLMQGKTTIVVAHRLSTLLHMDRILVFNQGKIIEDGAHTQLLGKGGLYKTLWDAQAGGFLPDTLEAI